MSQTHARLYDELAWLWPHLSPPQDYEAEAQCLLAFIQAHGPQGAGKLLELGAGGGHTICHLTGALQCTALDASQAMLQMCRELNPGVQTVVGDMRDFTLDDRFDVILIHDAIDYLLSEADLKSTFAAAARHLKAGGLLLVAPTYVREQFVAHELEVDQQELPDGGVLSYVQYVHDPDPDDTRFELLLVYLIHQNGRVRVEEDRHVCGLFDTATWEQLLAEAGFALLDPGAMDVPWHLFAGRRI